MLCIIPLNMDCVKCDTIPMTVTRFELVFTTLKVVVLSHYTTRTYIKILQDDLACKMLFLHFSLSLLQFLWLLTMSIVYSLHANFYKIYRSNILNTSRLFLQNFMHLVGLEPTRDCSQGFLRPPRIPIPT